jgi:peroxiredoxin Q/BCP
MKIPRLISAMLAAGAMLALPLGAARAADAAAVLSAALLAVGAAAPAFKLPDQTGTMHSLEQYRGKWLVLYFYPKDDTPGCTTEACEFRDNIFAFRKAGAVVLGVSVDDVDSHKKFAEKHSLPFPLLADSTKATAQAYGVLYKAMGVMEIARRETFIIDPRGHIAQHYTGVTAKGHSEAVLADLKTLMNPKM